jgi:hypothetical protein
VAQVATVTDHLLVPVTEQEVLDNIPKNMVIPEIFLELITERGFLLFLENRITNRQLLRGE